MREHQGFCKCASSIINSNIIDFLLSTKMTTTGGGGGGDWRRRAHTTNGNICIRWRRRPRRQSPSPICTVHTTFHFFDDTRCPCMSKHGRDSRQINFSWCVRCRLLSEFVAIEAERTLLYHHRWLWQVFFFFHTVWCHRTVARYFLFFSYSQSQTTLFDWEKNRFLIFFSFFFFRRLLDDSLAWRRTQLECKRCGFCVKQLPHRLTKPRKKKCGSPRLFVLVYASWSVSNVNRTWMVFDRGSQFSRCARVSIHYCGNI